MKLTVGVISSEEAEYFASSGADELYCGINGVSNHRDPSKNLAGLGELATVLKHAHRNGKPAYLAVNEIYPESEYGRIHRTIKAALAAGLDGVIMRDLGLKAFLDSRRIRTYYILSSLGACFNGRALEFYAGRGFSRVVLPQQLTPGEAGPILKNRFGVEAEVFLHLHCYCINMDGVCFLHDLDGLGGTKRTYPCFLKYDAGDGAFLMPEPEKKLFLEMFYDYYKGGAAYLKIARDANSLKEKARTVASARRLLSLAGGAPDRGSFLRRALKASHA